MKGTILFILILIPGFIFSQSIIKGTLNSQSGEPITNASVTITHIKTGDIIAYGFSNNVGEFSIPFTFNTEKLKMAVRSMGYEETILEIDNQSQTRNFILKEQQFELEEVMVKIPPIIRRGDTINYAVSAFSNTEDRSIADVLKRMPGIEVLKNGTILYMGTPINKFYIEGMDLLEGKYSLANNNLPHQEVLKVQILENHQPIKILDSLEFSDKAALNLQLKNKNTFTGQVKAGTGISPLLWDANVTPMLFSPNKQMLVSYQTNNSGRDNSLQLKNLTPNDYADTNNPNSAKFDWLHIQQMTRPNLSEKYWLDNNTHIISGNFLQKFKQDYELRLNISFLNDKKQLRGSTQTYFFTSTDTISLFESQHNTTYSNSLETNITLHKNTEKNYFKNSLQFQGFWDKQNGRIITSGGPITQNLSNPFFRLSNNLNNVFAFKKQLINFNSYISLNKTPQNLNVSPGQFGDILNNERSYSYVVQNVEQNTFITNNSLGFTKGAGYFTFSPLAGVLIDKQELNSILSTSENVILENHFSNNMYWARSKSYLDLRSQFRRQKWRLEIGIPLNFHSYKISDKEQTGQTLNQFTFDPHLSINYDINTYWRIGSSASRTNSFGSVNQIHYAYILKNYRNLQRINSPLPEVLNQNAGGTIAYRNPLQSLFANINYSFNHSNHNLIYETEIHSGGAIELNAFEEDNLKKRHNLSGDVSTYFEKIKSSITLNTHFSFQEFQLLLNQRLTAIENINQRFGVKIDTDVTSWLSSEFNSTILFSHNRIQNNPNRVTRQQTHHLKLNLHLTKNQYIGFNTEYVNNDLFSNKTENIFSDLLYRFKLKNRNIDLELHWSNIFNTRHYTNIAITDYSYIETNYSLRPSQLLVMVQFSL